MARRALRAIIGSHSPTQLLLPWAANSAGRCLGGPSRFTQTLSEDGYFFLRSGTMYRELSAKDGDASRLSG
jgi:hypothetical protein